MLPSRCCQRTRSIEADPAKGWGARLHVNASCTLLTDQMVLAAGSGGGSGGGSNDNKSGPSGHSSMGKWQPSQLAVSGGGPAGSAGGASGLSPTPAAQRGAETSGSARGFAFSIPQAVPSGTASGNASNAPTPPRWHPAQYPAAPLEASGHGSGGGGSAVAALQRPEAAAAVGNYGVERGGDRQPSAVQAS